MSYFFKRLRLAGLFAASLAGCQMNDAGMVDKEEPGDFQSALDKQTEIIERNAVNIADMMTQIDACGIPILQVQLQGVAAYEDACLETMHLVDRQMNWGRSLAQDDVRMIKAALGFYREIERALYKETEFSNQSGSVQDVVAKMRESERPCLRKAKKQPLSRQTLVSAPPLCCSRP